MEQYLIAAIVAQASVIVALWLALQRQGNKKDAIIEELAKQKDKAMKDHTKSEQEKSKMWEEMARSYMEHDDEAE